MAERIYDPAQIEHKWQARWAAEGTNQVDVYAAKNPYYVLMMFPYPSAEGLHVGNVYAFTGADIHGRFKRLQGFDVFEPVGFDAFGIHSENFAMKINRHPAELIPANVRNFTRQLTMMGFMYDWRHVVDTTSPEYYRWTQWIFLQLYKAGFAYRDTKEVNFCPQCGTVIADEQVNTDGTCERHGDTMVERRKMPCWFFSITKFAKRLSENHEWLDWSETTKTAQLNWIGRSKGAEVDFLVDGRSESIRVFTTRPDTLFGATFMVMAPEHPMVDAIAAPEKKAEIAAYKAFAQAKAQEGGTGVPPVRPSATPSDRLGDEVHKRQGAFLPHWTQDGRVYSVAFRLGDSLPQATLREYQQERADIERIARESGRPLAEEDERRLAHLYSEKIESYLDKGTGECVLANPEAAEIVAGALKHFEGERYRLFAWCVMPNHVHVVVQPLQGHELADILHSWKSFTAHEINRRLGREGALWQAEYFDHILRNEGAFFKALEYVWQNPDQVGLRDWKHRWRADASLGRDAQATLKDKDKTGVFTGAHAINPLTGGRIPIFVADYVMMGYGTGAIMAVPSGDHRDFEFAKKFGLPVPCIIEPDMAKFEKDMVSGIDAEAAPEAIRAAVLAGKAAWSGPGKMVNSANADLDINGLPKDEAVAKTVAWLEKKGLGKAKDQFRLRDWGISRQRYWGPPIPIVYDEDGNAHPVPEDQLPVELPPIKDFRPKGDGRGPLANVPEWVNVEIGGKKYRRETDVMDNFLDSAWYFLRYPSARDAKQAYDPKLMEKWLPVDMYIGGNEHAVLHLLYTRFVCMALAEAGVLKLGGSDNKDAGEPFKKFRAHGLLVRNGSKMSKSKGNVVNPDEFVATLGADTLRTYLMFLGPYTQGGDFRDTDIQGVKRFFNRTFAYYFDDDKAIVADEALPKDVRVKVHQTIKKVGADMEALSYNTAIAALMELLNVLKSTDQTSDFVRQAFCIMLAPLAPHLAEEIWREGLGNARSVFDARWPAFEPALTVLDEIEIPVQVNGKLRDKIVVARTAAKEEIEAAALKSEGVQRHLAQGGAVKKTVVVPGRLVNFIVA